MKSILHPLALLLLITACSKDDDLLQPATLVAPSVMEVFCQHAPDSAIRTVEYAYDNDQLIKQTLFRGGIIQGTTTFEYDQDDRLLFEVFITDRRSTEKSFIYNDLGQLINVKYKFIEFDENGQIREVSEKETPREYVDNLLVKEWEYWGGFVTYTYQNGRLDTKIEHTKNGKAHHFTTYFYAGDLLVRETKETKVGGILYDKIYKYDFRNRLTEIRDGENIIEQNEYNNDRLVEKRTYYFGIDPGFDICYGNYIYRFEY